MTSLSTSEKSEHENAETVSTEKTLLSANKKVTGKRVKNRLHNICITALSTVIALCCAISLFCGYVLTQKDHNESVMKEEPAVIASEIKPIPEISSVIVSDKLNSDFTRNVTINCRNDDGTTNGLYYYVTSDDSSGVYGEKNEIKNGKTTFPLSDGNYIIIVTNDSGKITRSDTITVNVDTVSKISIGKTDTYMNVGMNNTLTAAFDVIGDPPDSEKLLKWSSSDTKVAVVKSGKVIAKAAGKTIITASAPNGVSDSIEITVTDLLRAPKITATKPLLQPGQYTDEEGEIIDAVLESRVNTAGYGTRAGVVAAARFIPLEFNYKIPYFYENGRLNPQPERPYCDGEGRFYHKGLYLTHSKFDLLDKNGILYGPATWGEPLTNWEDAFGLIPGAKYANGMTCSGFVSWCLYNGGVPLGDVGAGDTPDYDYEYSDFGERVWLDEDVMRSGVLQVGDLIGCDGHIAIIAGFDDNNIYIAESLGKGIVMEVRERYREVWECGDYTYAMLMGDVYAEHNGDGNVTDMWTDYSDSDT